MQGPSSDFKLISSRNILVSAGKQQLLFDPTFIRYNWVSPTAKVCISHAHADHIVGFQSKLQKIVTPETLDLYKALKEVPRNVQPIVSDSRLSLLDDCTIQAHPAGHMLGASQFVVEKNGARLVYTGDFNLHSSMTAKGARPIPCDVLLMEATYGRPDAVFPPREQVYSEIAEWTSSVLKDKKIPSFQVYATGKAQEIIRIVNTLLTAPVVVDSTIAKISEVYKQHGIPLEFFNERSNEGREVMRQGSYVYLSSKRLLIPRTLFGHQHRSAVATGWAKIFPMRNADKSFILSAHADFQQLIEYINTAKPRSVYITCGNSVTFGAVLEKLNVKQLVPQQRRQLELSDFL